MRSLLARKPDLTLEELRAAVALECSLPAIHYAQEKMGLTYKNRRCGPASKTVPRSRGRAWRGGGANSASRGKRVHAKSPHGSLQTTTMICSMRLDGSIACMTI
jgi:hypothetical protein